MSEVLDPDAPLGRRVARGAAWLTALHIGDKIIDVASLVILARLLSPTDFGIIALGASIAAAVGLIQRTGFGSALIQNQTATRSHYDTAWTIQVGLSAASGLLLLAVAGPAAAGFDEPALETVIRVAALVMIVDGFGNIAIVNLQKNLQFKKDVLMRFARIVVAKLSVVAAAFYFLDYRALIVGMVVGSVVGLVLGYLVIPYRPRFTWTQSRSLFSFSVWLQLSTMIAYVNKHAQNFIVAALRGTADVGVLNISSQVASITGETIQGPISQASYPAFARKAHDKAALLAQYCSSLAYVTLLAMPTSVGIALVAPHVVPLFLGEKWLPAIPVIQVLALASVARAMTAASNPLYMAINRPRLVTAFASVRLVMLVPAIAIGTYGWGLIGTAWAVMLVPALLFPVRQWVVIRALSAPKYQLLAPAARPAAATVVMSLVFVGADRYLDLGRGMIAEVIELAVLVTLSVAVFTLAIGLLWRLVGRPEGPETQIAELVVRRARALLGAA